MVQQRCIQCGRVEMGGHLWCQQPDCPIGKMPVLFAYGECVGDVQVVKPLALLPTATFYQGQRNEKTVFLKVAHSGFQARLQREVDLLGTLSDDRHFLNPQPAYHNVPDARYGQVTRYNKVYYFAVFEQMDGESLRDYLLRTPIPWYQHTGQIVTEIANAIAVLHTQGLLHCTLSPDCVLVRTDAKGNPRVTLLDLGMAGSAADVKREWSRQQVAPAYIAPEMLTKAIQPSAATDTYGLGLILYEMLMGQAAFESFGRTNAEVWQAVRAGDAAYEKIEVSEWLPLLRQALSTTPQKRPKNLTDSLTKILPPIKPEPRSFDWMTLYPYAIGVLVVALLLATVAAFWNWGA